jgi:hypothetical protein
VNAQSPDQWLVRTAENRISGPYSRQQIRELIERGQLQLNDEVCQANTYWFYLHEHDEIRKQLGMELPKELYANPEEATQTEETDTEITDPNMQLGGTRVAQMGQMPRQSGTIRSAARARDGDRRESGHEDKIPELSHTAEELGENTAVMSNRAFRDFRQNKKPEAQTAPSQAPVQSQAQAQMPIERSKLLQWTMYLMIVAAGGLLAFVIKLLREHAA